MTVSAALLVKDPPLDRLALLVEYLRPVVTDFVMVVDDRTAAETVDVLSAWRDVTIVPYRWADDFSAGRNVGLPRCKGTWTLIVDPDELPSAAMLAHVHEVDTADPPASTYALGFLYWTVNYWAGVLGPEMEYHWHVRLFQTGRGKFYRPIHELVELNGMPESATRETLLCPKAPREAYLIHSKGVDAILRDDAVYGGIVL